jgi:hypothetical protein
MISCEEAAVICNKSQYREASLYEKIKLKFHVLFCASCALFSKKNKKLTSLYEKANLHCLTEDDKITLKKNIKGQL